MVWNIRGISDTGSFDRLKLLVRDYKCPLGSFALRLGFSHYTNNVNNKIWASSS